MIFVGRIVSDIPSFTGKWFSILIAWNTKWIINSLVTLLKGKLCHIDLILSLSCHIFLSISATCSLSLALLNIGPPGISCINTWSDANLISTYSECIFTITFKVKKKNTEEQKTKGMISMIFRNKKKEFCWSETSVR